MAVPERTARPRRYLMCRPEHFDVTYQINPWMDLGVAVDTARALGQWEALVDTYRELGHEVHLIEPAPDLPDMVFAANAGVVLDARVYGALFLVEERRGEEALYRAWFAAHGFVDVVTPREVNEGAGDLLAVGDVILGAHGFRTSRGAHREAEECFTRPVVSLELVDPRFYHLDTALAVLDRETIAYYPGAFAPAALRELQHRFPDAIVAGEADAVAFGLNATSDGRHVVLSADAVGLIGQLRDRGFHPIGLDLSELRKAGGSAKCCTLELAGWSGPVR
ncbi:MAG: arginine deiminase-related protein [Acidimicrobiales bacterium]|nr:arginine deiminase-related protein [Acidimicrobiales bacterium]